MCMAGTVSTLKSLMKKHMRRHAQRNAATTHTQTPILAVLAHLCRNMWCLKTRTDSDMTFSLTTVLHVYGINVWPDPL